ncbi:hypothetical protein E2C01_089199 [Portunus trituberculatus]|uniref:Secreted peptide n=1 Tax=Portunus trituberculatus TaxID=210409 RepID=A0A5B7JLT2_PORTR|nr:hypothetical protein [Portunus trituberculatus]
MLLSLTSLCLLIPLPPPSTSSTTSSALLRFLNTPWWAFTEVYCAGFRVPVVVVGLMVPIRCYLTDVAAPQTLPRFCFCDLLFLQTAN